MIEIQAPNDISIATGLRIFLAGSIEMGVASRWQQRVLDEFKHYGDVTFFNPRRTDWDSSWEQTVTNPQFKEQVNWELDALDKCDMIIMYFDPNTLSPITLLEFGRYVGDVNKSMLICCPDVFWRKGNIEVMCERYNRKLLDNFDDLLYTVHSTLCTWSD